ncbi:MAG: methylated-DNA--[protein]-cysteine S-methyltransferase [Chromatiales bacterium]
MVLTTLDGPLGPLTAAANATGICLLEFGNPRRLARELGALQRHFRCAVVPGENAYLRKLRDELARYFAGTLRDFTIPVVLNGTDFQRAVWGELMRIPYGETCSYEDVARRVGNRHAQRAVGAANGANRVVILIPCHRVVSKSSTLGGYSSGLWRKKYLLQLERAAQR